MGNRSKGRAGNSERGGAGPPAFGLPTSSPLTVEGRIERAAGVGRRLSRIRRGQEQAPWRSGWPIKGLALMLVVIAALIIAVSMLLSQSG
ncbi:MAG: hypothetical protein ACYCO3_09375 [Mycobacteriales bacterium]